jgi:hypothetical protein
MNVKKALVVFAAFSMMSGCATSPEALKEQYEKVAVAHKNYENQIVSEGQPHAFISGIHHSCEDAPVKASLFCAFVVRSVDGKPVEFTVPYDPFSRKIGYFSASYSQLLLKIPTGTHDITIEGGTSRPYRSNLTIFKGVSIEVGKFYAITSKIDKNNDEVNFIAEYEPDNNFHRSSKRHFKIIRPASLYVYPNSDKIAPE